VQYPKGINRTPYNQHPSNKNNISYANRGMSLEDDINDTNKYYLVTNRAVIHKKPTPIQIVKVHYPKRSAAVITEGYFQEKATTDYNGIYRSKYIDFEAKETRNKTTFPLNNIHEHQIDHMRSVLHHGGISFFIIRFTVHDVTYYFSGEKIISFWDEMKNGGKNSIPYNVITDQGYPIPFTYQARVDYLTIIDQLFFD
jgi:recombination protein U